MASKCWLPSWNSWEPRVSENTTSKKSWEPCVSENTTSKTYPALSTGKSRLVLILFDARFKTLCRPTISHYMIDKYKYILYIYISIYFSLCYCYWVIITIIVIPYSLYILYLPKTNTSPTLPQVPHKYSARSTCSKTLSLVASPQKQIRGGLAGTPKKSFRSDMIWQWQTSPQQNILKSPMLMMLNPTGSLLTSIPCIPFQHQLRTRLDASPRAEGCDIGGVAAMGHEPWNALQ